MTDTPHCLPYMDEAESRRTIGQKIKTIRRLTGLSQAELGDIFGVGKRAVAAWEAGESDIKLEYLYMLSQAYGVPLDYFFNSTKNHNSSTVETYYLLQRLPRSLRELIIAPEYESYYPSNPRGNHSYLNFDSIVTESFYEGFADKPSDVEKKEIQYYTFNEYVGNRLATLRKSKGFNQFQFSRKLGVSRTLVSSWEARGGGLDPFQFSHVLYTLDVSPTTFFESNLEIVGKDGTIIYDRPEFINSWPIDTELYYGIQTGSSIKPQLGTLEAAALAEALVTSPLIHCYHEKDIYELKRIYFINGKNCKAKKERYSPETQKLLESKEIALGSHLDFAKYTVHLANKFVAVSRAQIGEESGRLCVRFQDEDIKKWNDSIKNT